MTATPEELKALLKKGYTFDQINAMKNDDSAIQRALGPKTAVGATKSSFGTNKIAGTPSMPMANPVPGATAFKLGLNSTAKSTGTPKKTSLSNLIGGGLSSLGNVLSKVSDVGKKSGLASGVGAIVKGVTNDMKAGQLATSAKSMGDKNRALYAQLVALRDQGALPGQQIDQPGALSYDPGAYQQPNFTVNDFTDEAGNIVKGAYEPRYQAIDLAAEGLKQQHGRADTLTKGLYDNLAASIAKSAEDTKAGYAQKVADQAAATGGLQQNIANTYSSAQNQEAALLKQLGQEQAAPEILSQETADSGWNQSMAATQGEAQKAAINQQGAGQVDYMNNVRNAEQTQGVVSREDLINKLGIGLSDLDAQRLGLAADQSSAAISLGQQMSDRDLQLQQANYGGYQDAYNANADTQKTQLSLAQQAQQQALEAQNAQRDRVYRAQNDAQQQYNADRDYQLSSSKYATDLATQQAQLRMDQQKLTGQSSQPLSDTQDPVSKTVNQIADSVGGDLRTGNDYYNYVAGKAAGLGELAPQMGLAAFVSAVTQAAAADGRNPDVAARAASAYYANVLGKGQ